MTATQLKTVYDLIAKYEKIKWTIKKEITIFGKSITLNIKVDNFLGCGNWYDVNIFVDGIKTNKDTEKVIKEIEILTGLNRGEWDVFTTYAIESELEKELNPFFRMKLPEDVKIYIQKVLYKNDKFQPWSYVEKNFDWNFKSKQTVIELNKEYNALVIKDEPVQVGCQRIPISKVREIIEAYDKL